MRILKGIVFILLCVNAGFTQNTATLKGKVFDNKTLEPLPGASVIFERNKGTVSDNEGNFVLSLPPGNVNVAFQYLGYKAITRSLVMKAGDTIQLEIGLEPQITQIDQVVVSAGRVKQRVGESTVSLSIIRPETFSLGHITDTKELINKTSGIEVLDGQASIRGGSGFSYGAGSRVLTLVDGLPVLAADAGNIRWRFLPMENISQIEIIKGASSVLYGSSALNGVINFRTAEASKQGKTSFYAETGIFDRPAQRKWVWWETPRTFTNFSFSHLKKYNNTEVGIGSYVLFDEGYRRLNDEKLGRVNLRLVQHNQQVSGLTYGIHLNGGYTAKTDFVLWENAETGALRQSETSATRMLGTFLTIDPFITFSSEEKFNHELRTRIQSSVNSFPDGSNNDSDALSLFSEYQTWYNISDFLNVNAGLLQNSSRIRSLFYGDHTSLNAAAYLQADITPVDRLTIVAGTRLEHNSLDGEADKLVPLFRAGLNFRALDFTFLRASLGQGYRYPSIAEKHAATTLGAVRIFPSIGLKAESGWNTELGLKQGVLTNYWNGLIDIAFFYSQNKNLIEYVFGAFTDPVTNDSGFGFRAENTEYSRVYGFELEFTMSNTFGQFFNTVNGGYVYMYPVEFNIFTNENTGVFLKYRRKQSATLNLNTQFKALNVGLSMFLKSQMLNIDDVFLAELTRETILPGFYDYWTNNNKGYLLMDFNVGYNISKNYKLSLAIKNLTNTEYIGRPGDIQPQRHFSLRITGNY